MEPGRTGRPGRRWEVSRWDAVRQQPLARALGLRPLVAQLLLNRGIDTPEAAHVFLNPTLADLPSPFGLTDMEPAVDRLTRALLAREPIYIYGDYDLDGVSGSALLVSVLQSYGADVRLFIPDRERDGYGLQQAVLERLAAQGARLIITCDNGTSALEEIRFARARGIDVIVTDHHSLPEVLPPAVAVLNPMRRETPEVFRVLSGAGVAFMLALGLRRSMRERAGNLTHPNLRRLLDLVTLGTVADVVPLTGINRILVRHGLEEIDTRQRIGLRYLIEATGVRPEERVSAATVGYRLAPRLNAAGRLDSAEKAVRLLLTTEPREAQSLVTELEQLNRRRQTLEEEILADIDAELSRAPAGRSAYVFGSSRWHPGVVGVVAARLVERTNRPGVVIALQGAEGRGSGRSVAGFDLVQALDACQDLLIRYGGHQMAVGLTLHQSHLEAFTERIERLAAEHLAGREFARTLSIDAELPFVAIDEALVEDIEMLRPFGVGNPEPVFTASDLQVLEKRTVGRGHLRLRVSGQGRVLSGIGFRLADLAVRIPREGRVSLAYCPQINHWRGARSVQLRLWDLRA